LLGAVFCWLTPGCSTVQSERKTIDAQAETQPSWSDNLRTPGPKGQQMGLDSRAREIERHVGFN
jgi:hypothetical protein